MKSKVILIIYIIIGVAIGIVVGKMSYHFLWNQPTSSFEVGNNTYYISVLDKTSYADRTEYKLVFKNAPNDIDVKLSSWETGNRSYISDGVEVEFIDNTVVLSIESKNHPDGNISLVYYIENPETGAVESFQINEREYH